MRNKKESELSTNVVTVSLYLITLNGTSHTKYKKNVGQRKMRRVITEKLMRRNGGQIKMIAFHHKKLPLQEEKSVIWKKWKSK